jgi:hypothetical protein
VASKSIKKIVTIAYTYKIEGDNQKCVDHVIKSLTGSPSYGFMGGGMDGCYSAELKKGKGKVIDQ